MKRCIDLASAGLGNTAPNPMVGAVIVHRNRIIGEGYHSKYGEPHAEWMAIRAVRDARLLEGSTLYVNLEPCSHTGKTPPCSRLITEKRIPHVVVGTTDSNPLVRGEGILHLRKNGTRVTTGILEEECRFLNRRFFTFHEKQRPYIILKWAQTADGFVDRLRFPGSRQEPLRITGDTERILLHKWRAEEQSIMVGTRTATMDNPQLNVRHWKGRHPLRLIPDRTGCLDPSLQVFDGTLPTLVFTEQKLKNRTNVEYARIGFGENFFANLFSELVRRQIQSVLVEGGPSLIRSFLLNGSWDEARVFTGRMSIGLGLKAPVPGPEPLETMEAGNSRLNLYFR